MKVEKIAVVVHEAIRAYEVQVKGSPNSKGWGELPETMRKAIIFTVSRILAVEKGQEPREAFPSEATVLAHAIVIALADPVPQEELKKAAMDAAPTKLGCPGPDAAGLAQHVPASDIGASASDVGGNLNEQEPGAAEG